MTQGISWAARRRAIAIIILALIVSVGILFFNRTVFYNAPSCVDGTQNQNETGVDCGGTCPYLCTAQVDKPVVQFVRTVSNGAGRTDLIAYIENPNIDAAVSHAPYTVDIYGTEGTVIAKRTGFITLSSHSITPIFIPGVVYNSEKIANTFLTFNTKKMHWVKLSSPRQLLPFSNIQVTQGATTHITATITNPSAIVYRNLKVIISVFNKNNNIIAASQTVVPVLQSLGTAPLVFTWSSPFSETPVREDLFPILPLAGK